VGARGRYGEPVAGSVEIVAEGDVDDCRVVLESGSLVGRVTGLRGERARVTVRAGDARGDLSHASDVVVTWTDPTGGFRIDDVGAGEWSVLAIGIRCGKGAGQALRAGASGVVRRRPRRVESCESTSRVALRVDLGKSELRRRRRVARRWNVARVALSRTRNALHISCTGDCQPPSPVVTDRTRAFFREPAPARVVLGARKEKGGRMESFG
jgi:hypothetical protein